MVDMRHIVAGLQLPKGFQRYGFAFGIGLLYSVFVITLEYLVVCIADNIVIVIDEAF